MLVAKYVARVRPGFMHERVLDVPVWLLTYRELLMVSPTDYQSHSQMRRYIYDKVFNASADNAIRILSQHGFTETELTDLFTWGSLWRNEEYFKYYDLFWMETQANSARLIFDEVFTTLSNPESTISDVKEAVGMLDQKVLSPISSGVKPLGNRSPQRFCQEQLVQLLHAVVAKNIPDDKLRATSTLVEYLNLTEWSKLNPLTQRKLLSASNTFYSDWRGEHYLRSTTIEDIVALCLENAIKEMQAIRALLNKDTFVYTLSENTHVRNTFFAMLETVLMPQLGTAALSQNQTTTIYAVLENTGVRMALGIHNPELLSRLRLNIAQAKTMKE